MADDVLDSYKYLTFAALGKSSLNRVKVYLMVVVGSWVKLEFKPLSSASSLRCHLYVRFLLCAKYRLSSLMVNSQLGSNTKWHPA